MNLFKDRSIKYKLLTKDELVLCLDRLSRFKLPEYTYNRVFTDIIIKCLISPQYSKKQICELDSSFVSKVVEKIWNDSVKKIYNSCDDNNIAYNALKTVIKNTFDNIPENTKSLMKAKLNIMPVLKGICFDSAPFNLQFLIQVSKQITDKEELTIKNLTQLRQQFGLIYPIEKLLIVEGITEEILLPVFADKINKSFNRNGIYILGAGGKSKSPSLYLKLKDKLKTDVVLLFDNDAKEICTELKNILLKKDRFILIESGEFEDLLSENLIKRTLNNEYNPATQLSVTELRLNKRMCDNIENFYRTRHLGEFKKSKFAKLISENIKYDTDITEKIKEILSKIL